MHLLSQGRLACSWKFVSPVVKEFVLGFTSIFSSTKNLGFSVCLSVLVCNTFHHVEGGLITPPEDVFGFDQPGFPMLHTAKR